MTIEPGQIVGLLGLNGAGKTTTLRILACDLLPTQGSVAVGGIDVVSDPDLVKSKIGYLPDTPPLYLDMKVREYLQFAAKLRGIKGRAVTSRVDEVIQVTELARVADDLISTLSHGFKQRVGIAQAIVHGPQLVILDEPISGLDPVQIVEMRELIRSLRGNHTVIISSHILSEISETCDKILVMGDGKIIAEGTESELSERWLSGVRVEVLVRNPHREDPARLVHDIRALEGIVDVAEREVRESGDALRAFDVHMKGDQREQLVCSLVARGIGVLQISRSHRDLESVFLQLSDTRGTGAQELSPGDERQTGERIQ